MYAYKGGTWHFKMAYPMVEQYYSKVHDVKATQQISISPSSKTVMISQGKGIHNTNFHSPNWRKWFHLIVLYFGTLCLYKQWTIVFALENARPDYPSVVISTMSIHGPHFGLQIRHSGSSGLVEMCWQSIAAAGPTIIAIVPKANTDDWYSSGEQNWHTF